MFWPCETRTSTCHNFATISSGLYRFLAITVLLDVKDIPQVGPLQWGGSPRQNISAHRRKAIPAGRKTCGKILEGRRSAAKAPFGPTRVMSDDRTPFFRSAFFPGRSRTSYLGHPAIDPMPMIRMLIVSYVFTIWWRTAKLKATGALPFK